MENLDILTVINLYSMYKEILSIPFYVPECFFLAYRKYNMATLAIANYIQYVCMSSSVHIYISICGTKNQY